MTAPLEALLASLALAFVLASLCGVPVVGLIVAAGLSLTGVLFLHPSQLLAALIISAFAAVTLAAGREYSWRAAAVMGGVLVAACLALVFGGALWQPLASFMDMAAKIGVRESRHVQGRYLLTEDDRRSRRQIVEFMTKLRVQLVPEQLADVRSYLAQLFTDGGPLVAPSGLGELVVFPIRRRPTSLHDVVEVGRLDGRIAHDERPASPVRRQTSGSSNRVPGVPRC